MKSVRKRQVGVQNRLLYFVSRAGGVSHPHRTVADMDGLINPYCTCSKGSRNGSLGLSIASTGQHFHIKNQRERKSCRYIKREPISQFSNTVGPTMSNSPRLSQ